MLTCFCCHCYQRLNSVPADVRLVKFTWRMVQTLLLLLFPSMRLNLSIQRNTNSKVQRKIAISKQTNKRSLPWKVYLRCVNGQLYKYCALFFVSNCCYWYYLFSVPQLLLLQPSTGDEQETTCYLFACFISLSFSNHCHLLRRIKVFQCFGICIIFSNS